MSDLLPPALQDLIEALGNLPGVGARTAERYGYYLFKSDPSKSKKLSGALLDVHDKVKLCRATFCLIDEKQEFSDLYTDPRRDKTVVAVVEDPLDVVALEKTGLFKGTYHVLGGSISPIDGIGPENLTIPQLLKRVESDKVTEVILATNASVEGETTALYLERQLGDKDGLKITRLARGIPVGVDLEYADQISLGKALEGRQVI